MADIFCPEHLAQMVFLQAMVSDEAMKARLAALIDAQTKAQAAMGELHAQEAKNAAILHEANQKVVEAATAAMNAEAVRREAEELKAHAEKLRDTYWKKHKRLNDALSASE